MKGLKIINDIKTMLSNHKTNLDYYLDEEFGKMTVEEIKCSENNPKTAVGSLLAEIEKTNNCINQLQQIKQDLEVLEIIRNKKVDLQGLSYLLNEYKDAELAYILNQYNPTEYYTRHLRGCLTLEELLKIKQWLEVNENE